jgi:hypothetical protein
MPAKNRTRKGTIEMTGIGFEQYQAESVQNSNEILAVHWLTLVLHNA